MKNCTIYPNFLVIKAEKEECYPYKHKILFQEYLAEVNMQTFVYKKALKSIPTFTL